MTPEQLRRVRDLFEAALDRDASSQRDWIAREAADDPSVRDEVQSLLDHHSRAGAFLSVPIVERAPDLLADDEPLAAGATIGTYAIIRELGRGGMGRVYLASDARLGRTVALKALAPHLVRDPLQRERLRREARAAAALTHPGICTVYALEEIDGELYIASEYVDGATLGDEIRRGRRPGAGEILRTARELAAALASAHVKGVVHRDLKPDNVMRARDGRLKILDFGLARFDVPDTPGTSGEARARLAAVTQTGTVVGTPAYMAPEQINGLPVDARADVFAFGVVLYEYVSGRHPFLAATPLATLARVLESDAHPLSALAATLPDGIEVVLTRCLRKAPADRFGSAAEIVGALAAVGEIERITRPRAAWWSAHQVVIVGLYVLAAVLGWLNKERVETPATVSIFLALGAAATVGGVLRGHLVFTARMNQAHLTAERRRAERPTRLLDIGVGALLFLDGVLMAATSALSAVLAISLALGIVLARLVLEPATTTAAFGRGSEEP